MDLQAELNQVVVFKIDDEFYAIDILKVQEIVNYMTPSPIPNTPEYFKGVINLRGIIIPVIDLRARFNFEKPMNPDSSVVVVVSIDEKRYGLIVDSVSDVITIPKDDIQKSVDMHTGIDYRYILGLAKSADDNMIILVNIDKIFRKEEIETIDSHVVNK